MSLHRAANMAKLLAHLLSRDALTVGTLKVVKWHTMSQRMLFFWQVPCLAIRVASTRWREPNPCASPHVGRNAGLLVELLRTVASCYIRVTFCPLP